MISRKSLIAAALTSVAAVAVSGTPNISFAQVVSDTLTATITRADSTTGGTSVSTSRSTDPFLQSQ